MERTGRTNKNIRKMHIIKNFCPNAEGSVNFEMGNTRVICAVSIGKDVPDHAAKKRMGWMSAEYTLLPYSTKPRTRREYLKRDGRSVEIQRLIGRTLRGIIDLTKIPDLMINIDCDVLQADGGTRTAAITGACIALYLAIDELLKKGVIAENPLTGSISAISVGIVDGQIMLDLDYSEDSRADVDLNIVMNDDFEIIELQGTGERSSFTRKELNEMLDVAQIGIEELFQFQKNVLSEGE